MNYGNPSIADALQQFKTQASNNTHHRAVISHNIQILHSVDYERIMHALKNWPRLAEHAFHSDYHQHPAYVTALSESVETHWQQHQKNIYSFRFTAFPNAFV